MNRMARMTVKTKMRMRMMRMKRKKMMTKMMRMKKKMMMNRMEHFYIVDKSFIKNDMYKMYAYILNK